MRTIRILAHISLDGVIAPGDPNENSEYSNGGWTAPFRSPGAAEMIAEAQGKGFDLLLGRRTYDLWTAYWPTVKGGLFADAINSATKHVATHRPQSLAWGPAKDLGGDILSGVRRLKSGDGPDLVVWGSSTLTSLVLEDGLVDEVVLIVYPVLLGRGKRFFSDAADARQLALVATKSSASGVLLNTYRHVGSLKQKAGATQ